MGIIGDKIATQKRQFAADVKRLPVQITYLFGFVLLLLSGLLILAGGYIVVSQLVLWLKSGVWVPIPLLYMFTDPWPLLAEHLTADELERLAQNQGTISNILQYIGILQTPTLLPSFSLWLTHPQEWIGVHMVIRWVLDILPTSLTIIIMGVIALGLGLFFSVEAEDELKEIDKEERLKSQ